MDYLNKKKDNDRVRIGKMNILQLSFSGSPRSMKQNFLDSMTIVQRLGKPDYFITKTCNPNWKEIKENLFNNDLVIIIPDIIAKVFHGKVKEFLNEVDKKFIFGRCIAYTYVIEFQKRGLSHMHMLLFVDQNN